MSEELLQRGLLKNPEKIGKWDFYNIGSTSIKALKEYGIIRNVDYGNVENKKVDALIVQKKNVIAIIEYKKPSQFKTKTQKDKAIKQEIEVAKKLGSKIIIATDTKDTVWVNALTGKKIKDENGKEINSSFDPKAELMAELIDKINYSINENNNNLKPKELVNPTDLAKQIWQDIWMVSGATAENCLYTFIELFIFKYLSDLNVLKGIYNFNAVIDSFKTNTAEEILENYANVIRPKIKELFPENPIDKTTIINGTIFVSKDQKAVRGYSTVFKKVLQKFQDYGKLEHIEYDFKSLLFESFLKESISKKNWGQFFTPLKVVRAIIEMAKDDIKEGAVICDPACGVGKFLLEPIKSKLDYFYKITKNKIKPKITIHGFDKGFDHEEQKTIILAKANMLIYFSDLIQKNPNLTKEFSSLFNECFILKTNSILGTLSEPTNEKYDLILTNPPYVTSGSSNLKDEIKKDGNLLNYYKINAMGVEGLFMEWIIRALKPNGKAFVVVPDGILNRQNDKHLRKFILDECCLDGLISLPIKTFFTTPKKTYILCITKKANKIDIQRTPVFTYLVSEMGESRDVYRFDIEQNDLQEAVTLYSFFKGDKGNFSKINSDNRCKIQPVDKFKPEGHWSIDRWWTKEEKIALGILEEENAIDITGFSELVSDISETLSDFSNLLKEVSGEKKEVSNFKEVQLSDSDYFELSIGKRIVKKDIVNISGTIPIYSANVKEPIGFHTHSNIKDFSNNFVLWGIDGDFEFNAIPKKQPFVSTDHCGTIRILNDDVLPEYLMIKLEKVKHKYGFDRGLRASLKNMLTVLIDLPFIEDDKIDLDKQKEIIAKYEYIAEIKEKVSAYKKQIKELNIEISYEYKHEEFLINSIFDLPSIKGLTKTFIKKNPGNIPVYGGSQNETPFGFVADNLKGVKYFENCLGWNREGSVGYVFWHKHKFTTNDHHRPLMVMKEHNRKLDLDYLRRTVEDVLMGQGFKWSKTASKEKVEKLSIKIPINSKGEFDIEAQKQLSEKYKKIEEIKLAINQELDKIAAIEIKFE
ncbi:MAG: N-6 DNA methylase [Desulfobacteraceae bacterium]|nr:N-6 DNA methylase [Desulfobacteraceae bacterium]MCD4811253.1 N-6 DNA methylase [bacterium]